MRRLQPGLTVLAVLLLAAAAPARAEYFDTYTELQRQLGAGKFANAEQTATQLLEDEPKNALANRVLTTRAQARLEQGHVSDAVADWLAAIKQADNGQRQAAIFLELAAAMQRLGLGDNACAAIRQAVDAANDDESPMGRFALERTRTLGCPSFADRDFARLFQLPFQLGGSTRGTSLDSVFGGTLAMRFPDSWMIDESSRTLPDGINLVSKAGDALCAIRRTDGGAPIHNYIEAVSKEEFTRGVRPGGKLLGVNGREGKMGPHRAVEIDFGVGPLPGRLYVANHDNMTYSLLCVGLRPSARATLRNTAAMIAASMRWQS